MADYTLTAERDGKQFRFRCRDLALLIAQAGEFDCAMIVDISGNIVYSVAFPAMLKKQAS